MEEIVISVIIIKSFTYRNYKSIVIRLNPSKESLESLKEMVWNKINTTPSLLQYRKCSLDTFKLHYQAHGSKTNHPMISLENDNFLEDYCSSLNELGFLDQTEVSFFKKEDYLSFKECPEFKWE